MNRPQMLDCFAGEGGAAMGYFQAGWFVYCVDNDEARLANNPFPSHCGDVLVVMARLNAGGAVDFTHPDGRVEWKRKADFKAIHGSPTCTGYSRGTTSIPDRFDKYDRFIPVARALFVESGLPYVIENVEDAGDELLEPALLCGRMFGLGATDDDGTPLVLDRHRLFESNVALTVPQHRKHSKKPLPGTPPCACGKTHFQVAGLYGGGSPRQVRRTTPPQGRVCAPQPRSPSCPQRHSLDHREGHLPRHPPRLHAVHRPPAAQPPRGDLMSGATGQCQCGWETWAPLASQVATALHKHQQKCRLMKAARP